MNYRAERARRRLAWIWDVHEWMVATFTWEGAMVFYALIVGVILFCVVGIPLLGQALGRSAEETRREETDRRLGIR